MMKFGQANVQVYKGAYKPVDVYKNTAQLAGSTSVSVAGTELVLNGTYSMNADTVGIFGAMESAQGKNLCPPPELYVDNALTIVPNADGTFYVHVPFGYGQAFHVLRTLTLPAGTYTASSDGSSNVVIDWDGVYYRGITTPITFTLDDEQTVVVAFSYPAANQSGQELTIANAYIQIEKGNVSTAFERFFTTDGHATPICPQKFVAAEGNVLMQSKNFLNMVLLAQNNNSFFSADGNVIEVSGNRGTDAYSFSSGQVMFPLVNYSTITTAGIMVESHCNYAFSFNARLIEQGAYGNGIQTLIYGLSQESESLTLLRSAQTVIASEPTHVQVKLSTGDYSGKVCICIRVNNQHMMLKNIMFEKGDAYSSVYQGYGQAEITYPVLRALEVGTAGSGNLSLMDTNGATRHYLADVVHGTTLTRHIEQWQLSSDTLTGLTLDSVENGLARFTLAVPVQLAPDFEVSMLCTHFKHVESGAGVQGFYFQNGLLTITIDATLAGTAAEFAALVTGQDTLQTPVTFYFARQTPATEVLDIQQLATFPLYTKVYVSADDGKLPYRLSGSVKVVKTV